MENFKFFVVGDGGVGKFSFFLVYIIYVFLLEYIFMVFDNYIDIVMVDGDWKCLEFWDIVKRVCVS